MADVVELDSLAFLSAAKAELDFLISLRPDYIQMPLTAAPLL